MSKQNVNNQQIMLENRKIAKVIEQLHQELASIQSGIVEKTIGISTLNEDIKSLKKKKKILMPVGGQVYLYADILPVDNALVNVGANIFIMKKKAEAKEFLEKRITMFEEAHSKRLEAIQTLQRRYDEVNAFLTEQQMKAESQI